MPERVNHHDTQKNKKDVVEYGKSFLCFSTFDYGTTAFGCFHFHSFLSLLEQTFVAGSLGNLVDEQNHDQCDNRFEHAGCCREGIIIVDNTHTVYIGINDIRYVVNV